MKISVSVNLFAGAIVAALLVAAATGAYTLQQLRIGGPIYARIVEGKDLVADILPPPLYVIEAYLDAQMVMNDPTTLSTTQASLKQLHADYDSRRAYWRASTLDAKIRSDLTDRSDAEAQRFWQEVETVYLPALRRNDLEAARASLVRVTADYKAHRAIVDSVVTEANGLNAAAESSAARARSVLISVMAAIAGAAGLLIVVGVVAIRRGLVEPIRRMAQTMLKLSGGDNAVEILGAQRKDEIGEMAVAVQTFKEAAIEKIRLGAEAAEARRSADAERTRNEAMQVETTRQQTQVVDGVASGLEQLSAGALTFRLNEPFAAEYEKLRSDYNGAMAQLQETMTVIAASTQGIRSGTGEISQASDDLSKRTEQQAASLEETAAALDEITATVRKTAEGANHAREVVATARTDAELSSRVVSDAVAAMREIEQSSQKISQIIGVIDEIAFQTNLLALNAGVEAARAGDAGRGFAVVASEVRALAQRSADAAKEIKTLISASSDQVEQGVGLVGQTGEALNRIVTQVADINTVVAEIAASAQEQATGLHEVNSAVNQMDQVTQQNAAMVEQSTAASYSLAQETEELARLIARFDVGDAANAHPRAPSPGPVRTATQMRSVSPSRGGAARKPVPTANADSWQDF